jgi:hypothetical protein
MKAWNERFWGLSNSRLGRIAGLLVLAGGLLGNCWSAFRQGGGSDVYVLHMMGRGILDGVNVYDWHTQLESFTRTYSMGPQPGVFYPPSTGFAVLPFSLLPVRVLPVAWLAIVLAVAVAGVRRLVLFLKPGANWPLVAGIVLLLASTRWGTTHLQGAPLVMGLLGLFVPAAARREFRTAFPIAAFVVAFKFTLALPFAGLFLLRRQWLAVLSLGAIFVGLNALGFYLLGGSDAISAYRSNMAVVEAIDNINTPDPWVAFAPPRLDWSYLLFGLTRSLLASKVLAVATSAVLLVYLYVKAGRLSRPSGEFDPTYFMMPLVCLALLSVYHHHYDLVLATVPVLIAWLSAPERGPALRPYSLPLLVIMAVVPIGVMQNLLGQRSSDLYIGLFHLAFPLALTLALVDSLLDVRRLTPGGMDPGRRQALEQRTPPQPSS